MSALRLIVLGSGGVGKSSITCRYAMGQWVAKYDPTIEDMYPKSVGIDGSAVNLEILDTAGQEEYSALRESFMHTGDGFLLVYSITDDQTFEDLISIRQQILDAHDDPNVPMLLVGNKLDLADAERAVSEEEAQRFAQDWQVEAVEVSARTDTGVSDAFERIVRACLRVNPMAGRGGGGNVLGAGAAARREEAAADRFSPPDTPERRRRIAASSCPIS